MSDFLPLFPLNLVAYPGEKVNLHIFEPRYRQLINECVDQNGTFGIPTYLNERIPGYGTEMVVTEVAHRYDDGRLDIRTRGVRVFRLIDFVNPAPGKLYAHGEPHYYPMPESAPSVIQDLLDLVQKLYRLLDAPIKFDPQLPQPFSYQIAHGIGLSLETEYELLTIESETERQLFLLSHLNEVLPVLENMERTKERIRLNGHFRELGTLDW
jgi:Lon protease-like protein